MATIKLDNINCYYEIHGKGRPLVLIAGLGSDSQSWEPALSELAEQFQVVVFDNRGIGRTEYPQENFDIQTMAQDTIGLIEKLGFEKVDILGHSMGGYIAQKIAIDYPQKVEKLIIASIGAFTCERNKLFFDNMVRFLEEGASYELFLREFFFWIFTPEFFNNKANVDSAIKYLLDYPYPITLEGFRRQVETINKFSSQDKLNSIKARTLVIGGRKDILIRPQELEGLIAGIGRVESVFLEGAAHSIHMEQPRSFVNAIVNFLR